MTKAEQIKIPLSKQDSAGSPKADRIRVEAPEPEQKERRDPKKGVSGSEVAVQLAGVGYGAAGYSRQQRERGRSQNRRGFRAKGTHRPRLPDKAGDSGPAQRQPTGARQAEEKRPQGRSAET